MLTRISLTFFVQLSLMLQNLFYRPIEPDDFGWYTTTDAIRRHRFSNYSTSSHGRSSANGNSREECDITSNPNILFHNDIFIQAFWFGGFCNITYKGSDHSRMITGMNRQVLCYRTIAFADKLGIEGGNIGICTNANLFAKIYILVITYARWGGVIITLSAHCAKFLHITKKFPIVLIEKHSPLRNKLFFSFDNMLILTLSF